MKNVMSISAALFLMLGATTVFARTTTVDVNPVVVSSDEVKGPYIKKEGNIMLLNYLNLEGEQITIRVYDSNNRLLYIENIGGQLLVEKAFNFNKAYEGTYSLVVNYGNNKVKESLEVLR